MIENEEKDGETVTEAEETAAEETTEIEAETETQEVAEEANGDEAKSNSDPLRVSKSGVKLAAEPKIDPDKKPNFVCLYIGIAAFALGVVCLALSIGLAAAGVANAGVYLLIGSMISELAAISFCNAQKTNGQHKLTIVFKILSYIVMFGAVIFFAIGTGISATNKGE